MIHTNREAIPISIPCSHSDFNTGVTWFIQTEKQSLYLFLVHIVTSAWVYMRWVWHDSYKPRSNPYIYSLFTQWLQHGCDMIHTNREAIPISIPCSHSDFSMGVYEMGVTWFIQTEKQSLYLFLVYIVTSTWVWHDSYKPRSNPYIYSLFTQWLQHGCDMIHTNREAIPISIPCSHSDFSMGVYEMGVTWFIQTEKQSLYLFLVYIATSAWVSHLCSWQGVLHLRQSHLRSCMKTG